ncbi:hypothetical protein FRC01_003425 [Tulasnella sp. 417]|nr:hypothetical protein FRC01_003425 [Tulasnella sp. 417]
MDAANTGKAMEASDTDPGMGESDTESMTQALETIDHTLTLILHLERQIQSVPHCLERLDPLGPVAEWEAIFGSLSHTLARVIQPYLSLFTLQYSNTEAGGPGDEANPEPLETDSGPGPMNMEEQAEDQLYRGRFGDTQAEADTVMAPARSPSPDLPETLGALSVAVAALSGPLTDNSSLTGPLFHGTAKKCPPTSEQ